MTTGIRASLMGVFAFSLQLASPLSTSADVRMGDMIFPSISRDALVSANVITPHTALWPGGRMPVSFIPSIPAPQRMMFLKMCSRWSQISGVECVPRTVETNFVEVRNDGNGCYATVGMPFGYGVVNLGEGCWTDTVIMHELGHSFGRVHEQQRSDRDQYIDINFANIQPEFTESYRIISDTNNLTPYDHLSVMHYSAWAAALNYTIPVMKPKAPWANLIGGMGWGQLIGQEFHPSTIDGAAMRALYGPSRDTQSKVAVAIRFIDATSGRPIPGGVLQLNQYQSASVADGYVIATTPPGTYNATLTAAGYFPVSFAGAAISNDLQTDVWLYRNLASGQNISLKFTNSRTGQPLPNVTVRLNGITFYSDSRGVASRFVPYGVYQASVTLDGFTSASLTYNHQSELRDYPIALTPTKSHLNVRIIDQETGAPLFFAGLNIGHATYLSDQNGWVRDFILHGNYSVTISRGGYVPVTATLNFSSDITATVPLRRIR
jgi:hypothetical protein